MIGSPMTSTAGAGISLATIEEIRRHVEAIERSSRTFAEEIHAWMQSQGFDPARSFLVLPLAYRDELPSFVWPRCVRFSRNIEAPVLMQGA